MKHPERAKVKWAWAEISAWAEMRETFKSDLPQQHSLHMKLMGLSKRQLQYRLMEEVLQWACGFFCRIYTAFLFLAKSSNKTIVTWI